MKTGRSTKEKLEKRGITREEFLKAPSTRKVVLDNTQKRAADRLIALLPRVRVASVRRNVKEMTPTELSIALTASVTKLRSLASRNGYKDVEWSGYPVNPFWYN